MESQQMMVILMAMREDMKAGREKMDAMHEDMKAGREEMKSDREQRKAEREADREQRKRMMEEMMAIFGDNQEGTKSDPEQMEPSPGTMQPVGEHQEVTKEEAAVMSVGERKKRRRNPNLAAERRQRTRGCCGSQNRVTITDRKVSRRAAVARRRRDVFTQERTRVKFGPLEQLVAARRGATLRAKMAGRETSKRRTFGRKRQPKQEGRNGVKDLGGGWPRYLRKKTSRSYEQLESTGNLNATFGKTTKREIAKQIVRSTVGLQTINIWTLWRG
jgi:hypothetical protein